MNLFAARSAYFHSIEKQNTPGLDLFHIFPHFLAQFFLFDGVWWVFGSISY